MTVEYKQYGVSLAFTPIVLDDGRISMRVRPEVSRADQRRRGPAQLLEVPALTTRRAETTVELGSGQSFMIAGLLRNGAPTASTKAPFLGDIPILGALFRSTKFRRQETELVIVITPYLVSRSPADCAADRRLRAPTDPQRVWEGQTYTGQKGPIRSSLPPPRPSALRARPSLPGSSCDPRH